MDCPACKNPMIILELHEVEIDYCDECSGIWLDSGELEMLLDKTDSFIKLVPATSTEELSRKCPICSAKMAKVNFETGSSPVLLDKCTNGHGIWFDSGELKTVALNAGGNEHPVVNLLDDMFGFSK